MAGKIEDLIKIYNLKNTGKEFNPNKEQMEAIKHIDGPLFLVAVPGSGKTTVLIWRTVNMIVYQNVDPAHILLTTFTNKAAKQLKNKLVDILQFATSHYGKNFDISNMAIGTLHSICNKELEWAAKERKEANKIILDPFNQFLFIKKQYKEDQIVTILETNINSKEIQNQILSYYTGVFGVSRKRRIIKALVNIFNRISEEGCDINDLLRSCKKEYETFLDLYKNYRAALKEEHLTDYSLLQLDFLNLIRSNAAYNNKFKYIIVDEYQDTNAVQEKIYFALAQSSGNLCVVGDDDQSLYRFRGATVENFVNFENRFFKLSGRRPERINLSTNYRSWSGIVNFYKHFIQGHSHSDGLSGSNFGQYRVANKEINASRNGDNNKSLIFIERGSNDSIENVARLVKNLADKGDIGKCSDCAFLFPSVKSKNAKKICEQLSDEYGINFYNPVLDTVFEEEGSLISIGALVEIIGLPCIDTLKNNQKDYFSYLERARVYFNENIEQNLQKKINKYLSNCILLSKSVNNLLRGLNTEFSINNDGLMRIFIENSKTKINNWNKPIPQFDNDKIKSFREDLFRSFLYDAFFYYENRSEDEVELAAEIFPPEKFPVLTIHASKGLEFSTVILLDLPEYSKKHNSSSIEIEKFARAIRGSDYDLEPLDKIVKFDELRKYYVAFSRAKNLLVVVEERDGLMDEIRLAISSINVASSVDILIKEISFLFDNRK